MKNSVLLSLLHLVLAFSLSCTFTSTARITPNQFLPLVRDTNGRPLRSDTRYFVVPAIPGGGGVTRGPTFDAENDANFVCPFQVVQSPNGLGMPVLFQPMAPKQEEIIESTSLNINFYVDNPKGICNNTLWEVEGFPGGDGPFFLSTNGAIGNPFKVATWFQIKSVNDFSYKLEFCPWTFCTDIGIEVAYGERQLAVKTNNTFRVVFIKVDTDYGKSII